MASYFAAPMRIAGTDPDFVKSRDEIFHTSKAASLKEDNPDFATGQFAHPLWLDSSHLSFQVGEVAKSEMAMNFQERNENFRSVEAKSRLVLVNQSEHIFHEDSEQKIWHVRISSNPQKFDFMEALREVDKQANDAHKLQGRCAIYVTVGSISSWGVVLKSEKEKSDKDKTDWKPLSDKRFKDMKSAEKFMDQLKETYKGKELIVAEGDDPATKTRILETLVRLFHHAKARGAAVIIPDYMTASPNSALIQDALDYVHFSGPVVSVSCDDQVASCAKTANEFYNFENKPIRRGILFARTTHSFQLCPSPGVKHTDLYSVLGARLVDAISRIRAERQSVAKTASEREPASCLSCVHEADGVDSEEERDHLEEEEKSNAAAQKRGSNHNSVFVVAGGAAALRHVEQAVLVGIPIVVLEGSGRLCDFLPELWVRRFAASFDVFTESQSFCRSVGFPETNDCTNGRRLRQVR